MKGSDFKETIAVWLNIYKRVRFFKQMYPFSSILKEILYFPLDYKFGRRPITQYRNVTVAVTRQCNLKCEMCYFHEGLDSHIRLPFSAFTRVIDEVKLSRPCVILTGGEPFTHPDLLHMAQYVKDKCLPLQIFTNGTLVSSNNIDQLVKIGLDYINFTLLGDEVSHSRVAGHSKAYELFRKNLEYFAANRGKTRIILNFTLNPRSVRDIDHAVELTRSLRLDGLRFQHYNFLSPEELQSHSCIMNSVFHQSSETHEIEERQNLTWMSDFLIDFRRRLKTILPDSIVQWAPTLTAREIKNWYSPNTFQTERTCLYPWRGILLDADQKIYPCSKIYLELGNSEVESIRSIWNNSRMELFRSQLKKKLFPACARCCKL